jgi:UDP-N-acetyl-D-galactosamine dehydrogenase
MAAGRKISVTGLGYVGLPVAVAFGRLGPVIGYDSDPERIDELRRGTDRTGQLNEGALKTANLRLSADAEALRDADFHIVTLPTPVDDDRCPDLGPLRRGTETIGKVLKQGDVVVFESTVYPGATEEFCVPILESASGLRCGADFRVGYSPERINPGDRQHGLEAVTKVVAGCDDATRELIAAVYGAVVPAGIHAAPSIRVAEAAKVIENTQRDLNIALMNELAILFSRLGIDTGDVIRAASTKWNFMPFWPGLVGGHCIGVDPYYLTWKAESVGHRPEVILAGRNINDGMAAFVAQRTVQALARAGHMPENSLVTVLGFTFKENVPDTRNTAVAGVVQALQAAGAQVQVHDPLADPRRSLDRDGVAILERSALRRGQAVILAVPHWEYVEQGWGLILGLLEDGRGVVFDVRGVLDRDTIPSGVVLERL